jgi:hypothetical protein
MARSALLPEFQTHAILDRYLSNRFALQRAPQLPPYWALRINRPAQSYARTKVLFPQLSPLLKGGAEPSIVAGLRNSGAVP